MTPTAVQTSPPPPSLRPSATSSLYASLAYYDSYRHADLPTASPVQAQRDFFAVRLPGLL